VLLLVGMLVAGELAARYIVGMGDPPLFVLDPQIEYLLAPNQKCRRFGHDYLVNQWSMRSGPLAMPKPASEQRVLVVGDSIVNGGGRIDQSELATTLLCEPLPSADRPFERRFAANVSAPSWGPPNQLAYVKRFGTFDADVVIIVLNSDDWDDVPGLEYIGSAWPRSKPWCALQELVGVYGWKAVCRAMGRAPEPPPPPHTTTHEQDVEACRQAFVDLVRLARSKGAKVGVVQYMKKAELTGKPQEGYEVIRGWAQGLGIEPISTAAAFQKEADAGREAFLDGMHADALGQRLLAGVIRQSIDRAEAAEGRGKGAGGK
jgi:hypothetical protein